ncbi:sigma-54 interaction domain-containing protein [Sinanaerobacter sp. ZZT-01]|uniref:sigma-54 interaction domain-containing protein n=1 Tax=Sinanaerobacter sp. ZZT-01 TaxID=3111540 RepID=UPI002D768091|nr:sigma 54-interacting transcriptional regulator [Sinanaerobacter sp. ZZT-01]WRR92644.1 sigma 54-interacting transcriptional regulator [Sinanaerobacter sp. ZZT-01]
MIEKSSFREMNESILLDLMLNATNEAIVVINKNGIIEILSDAYADYLKIRKEDAIGKHVCDVIENTRLHIVLKTRKPEIAQMQHINGQNMIATRMPIMKGGKIIGVFGRVLFKNLKELHGLYTRINEIEQELSLYKNKFGKINAAKYVIDDLIGDGETMTALKETIRRIAKNNSNVLIFGESGTGKELFAHAIHNASKRSQHPLICLNCASIPENLLESELFGYEEGSFTGAQKGGRSGLFHAANKGTLFLDEIGDLPMQMQVKLLRVLQDKEIQKIGSHVKEKIDVRILAATNKNLYELIDQEQFRSDLFYRLNVISITIPPLRERREDIPLLVNSLIEKLSQKEGVPVQGISSRAMEYLKRYDWPGNVRELENILERAINFIDDDLIIKTKHLHNKLTGIPCDEISKTLKNILEETERLTIVNAMMQNNSKKSVVAKKLGISRTSLYEKLEKYNINFES